MKFPYATCALMLVIQASVWAQAVNGTIVGTITDQSGGLVPAAQVTITEANTNATRLVTSDGNGYFSFPDLPPGTYNVKVAKQGFTTAERTQVALGVNTTVRVDMELQPGQVTETVEVTTTLPELQTDTAKTGDTLTAVQAEQLPLGITR
jgi:hypothetical protein